MTYPPQQPYQPYPSEGGDPGYLSSAGAYASWIKRVGAYVVDVLPTVPFSILAVVLGQEPATTTGGLPTYNTMYYVFSALSLVVWGYNRWFLAGKTGQSWGRKALGIRLVKDDTRQPIGAGLAFGRDIAHFVDTIICLIGYLFPLWDAKRQTLADKLVKTVVVDV
jgi:uncharacterized RDD family membrane protein YckC